MENKLQELTDKIYKEGIEKVEQERNSILKEAEKKSQKLMHDAEEEKGKIIHRATQEAEAIKERAKTEIRMLSDNAIHALRQELTALLKKQVVDDPVRKVLKDPTALKEVMVAAVSNLQQDKSGSIEVVLPAASEEKLLEFLRNGLREALQSEPSLTSSHSMFSGFSVRSNDGKYQIGFSDKDFIQLLDLHFNKEMKELFGYAS